MQKKFGVNVKEILSMEEYIRKRKLEKEEEQKNGIFQEEKRSIWMAAELLG